MDIENIKLLGLLISIFGALGGYIWKASKQDSKIDQVKEDLDELKKKENSKITARLENATRFARLETQNDHFEKRFLELEKGQASIKEALDKVYDLLITEVFKKN